MTTIHVSSSTREKLAKLKASTRETYDDLIQKLMALVPEGDEEGRYGPAFRLGLLRARLDIKKGHVVSQEEAKRRLGL
jgi:hypothetical protein